MIQFERLDYSKIDWDELESYEDRQPFQAKPWLEFVAKTQGAEPVIARILKEGEQTGYFTSMIVRKFGLKMLGSPFPGWSTAYMGMNLRPDIPRIEAVEAVPGFAFKELDCVHLELMDRGLTTGEVRERGFDFTSFTGYEVDLTPEIEEVFASLKKNGRRDVRKAERNGVTVEVAEPGGFADEYYDMLIEVFASRGLKPQHDRERVRILIETVHPSGMLLLLRARDPVGRSIATALFPGWNRTMYFWGAASWRDSLNLLPNEAVLWKAIEWGKERGFQRFDMGGGGDYKRKFGGKEITIPWLRKSKYPLLPQMRQLARKLLKRY